MFESVFALGVCLWCMDTRVWNTADEFRLLNLNSEKRVLIQNQCFLLVCIWAADDEKQWKQSICPTKKNRSDFSCFKLILVVTLPEIRCFIPRGMVYFCDCHCEKIPYGVLLKRVHIIIIIKNSFCKYTYRIFIHLYSWWLCSHYKFMIVIYILFGCCGCSIEMKFHNHSLSHDSRVWQ